MSSIALQAEVMRGAYPERSDPRLNWLDQAGSRVSGGVLRWMKTRFQHPERIVKVVAEQGPSLVDVRDEQIPEVARELRLRLRREGFREELVGRCFALVREISERRLGQRHFDVQLIGGRILLAGMVAEMETGEGKTLTATLPTCTAALAGIPVHVITVNDYLASRDAEWMGPIYQALGLSVGVIKQGMDLEARREAYGCDVTYCTNKELAFDYLKDRIVLGRQPGRIHLRIERLHDNRPRVNRLLLRGLRYAIVDEADSVLIDEARTPLIIAGGDKEAPQREIYERALSLAGELELDRDFLIDGAQRTIRLTPTGEGRLELIAGPAGGVWRSRPTREELVRQALVARNLFDRDKHYLVRDDKVVIIDEFTGRVMPDRSWEYGLHQIIEVKEGCEITYQQDPLARISYQRFFRRYLMLAGMTGTAREVAAEMWAVYRLAVVRVPTNRPMRRLFRPDRIYSTGEKKWAAVLQRISETHLEGRPLLVGTRSVAASEQVSALLSDSDFSHQVLNARQDREEAEVVAQAGEPGRITVATNMAGRGTDIRITAKVRELGGLYVLATERHEARRIDRQLFGRCGRQGDPGNCEAVVSLDDDLVQTYGWKILRRIAALLSRSGGLVPRWIGGLVFRQAQKRAERLHSRARRDLLKMDKDLETALGFTGRPE